VAKEKVNDDLYDIWKIWHNHFSY